MSDFFPVPQVELLFTKRCNLNCSYCFEKDKNSEQMKIEDFSDFINEISSLEFYMFGGEPLMNLDFLTGLYDTLSKKKMNDKQKKKILDSITFNITNGTLIEQNIDIIKKYDLHLQISIDGPKFIHDKNRMYVDGRGSFDDVMKAVDVCIENNIHWTYHGAITNEEFPYILDIFKFYWDLATKKHNGNLDMVVKAFEGNFNQIIFESEYSDEDIDKYLNSLNDTFNYIMGIECLNEQQRDLLISNFFKRRGSSCIAGNRMIAMDAKGYLYPCHRVAIVEDRKLYSLGNIHDRKFSNYQLFNNFMYIDDTKCMFSSNLNNLQWSGNLYGMNWCPSTNIQTSESVFYQSSKYNLMIDEYNRFIDEILDYYNRRIK